MVVATAAAALIVASLFMLPWRLERSGELRWGPFYRPPISFSTRFEGPVRVTTFQYEEGEVAFDVLGIELAVFLFVAGTLYWSLGTGPEDTRPRRGIFGRIT